MLSPKKNYSRSGNIDRFPAGKSGYTSSAPKTKIKTDLFSV